MLQETETKQTIGFFATFLSLVAFLIDWGGGGLASFLATPTDGKGLENHPIEHPP